MSSVSSVAALEQIYGEQPPLTLAKAIAVLDEHCVAFLAQAPFAVLGMQGRSGAQHSLVVGGDPGVLAVESPTRLRLPAAAVPVDVADGAAAGLVALVPGYGETLRVNGRVRHAAESGVVLDVEEAFLHCARCVTRSKLWQDHPVVRATAEAADADFDHPDVAAFLRHARFLTLSTTDGGGFGDVSPKGDEPGFLLPVGTRTLALPDRPGNRRTDTWRNLIDNPEVSAVALVPGDDRVLVIRGTAVLSTDPELRARVAAGAAVPDLALVLDAVRVDLRRDPALQASGLWNPDRRIGKGTLPTAGEIWAAHVEAGSV